MRRVSEFLRGFLFLSALLAGGCTEGDSPGGQKSLSDEELRLRNSRIERDVLRLGHEDEQEQYAAQSRLVKIGAPAVAALIRRLEAGNTKVRPTAAVALGQIGDPRAVGSLLRQLDDPDELSRGCAAWALGRIRDPASAPKLRRLWMKDGETPRVRAYAAFAVRLITGDEAALAFVLNALEHEEGDVRFVSALLLGDLGEKACVPALIGSLTDSQERIRQTAWKSLKRITGENLPCDAGQWKAWKDGKKDQHGR